MPKYHRVLVRHRLQMSDELRLLPNSSQWSELHWCDIERTESNEMRVRIARAVQGARMPSDTAFKPLDPELAKKLLVIDCSTQELKPRKKDEPLMLRGSLTEVTFYCLVLTANAMFRTDFQPQTKLLSSYSGLCWIEEKRFDSNNQLRLQKCFTAAEIEADKRLQMRTASPADHYDLLTYSAELIGNLKQQYREWQPLSTQPVLQQEEVTKGRERLAQTAGVGHQPWQQIAVVPTKQDWRTAEGRKAVAIEMESVPSALLLMDRIFVHTSICNELARIKNNTRNQEEYQQALYTLLSAAQIPTEFSEDLTRDIKLFRDIMLRDSDDLNTIFDQDGSSKPSLALVYYYVLELVFLELQAHALELVAMSSEMYIARCPVSYSEVQLGRSKPKSDVMVGRPIASIEDDARLAARLQSQELGGSGRASGQSNRLPLFPRHHGRHGLFAPSNRSMSSATGQDPSAASMRLLLLVMGSAVCALGVYLAFSYLLTGAAVIAAGFLCLLASTLATNRGPTPCYSSPSVAGFGW